MTKKRRKREDALPMSDLFDLLVLTKLTEVSSNAVPHAPPPSSDGPEKRARKPFKIFHPQKAKQHRNYSRAQVMKLYNVTRNTLTNWINEGLITVPGSPVLFRGEDLNAFHKARHDGARWNCSPGEFLCFHCKNVSTLVGQAADIRWDKKSAGTLSWRCPSPSCGKPNGIFQSRSQVQILEELGVNLTSSEDDYSPSRRPGEIVQIPINLEVLHEPVE
ncbi:helix-turn-helix domain-containing protein [Kaistia defluvii]|uniref:DNA-binding protein n=1 Tax=Kaistia defluvii TaxID=410841 RepID=A0ABV2R6T9_9HYPH